MYILEYSVSLDSVRFSHCKNCHVLTTSYFSTIDKYKLLKFNLPTLTTTYASAFSSLTTVGVGRIFETVPKIQNI